MIGRMMRTSPILSLAEEYLTGLCTAVKLVVKRNDETSEEAAEALERQFGLGKYEDAGGRMGEELAKQCERVDEIASSADAVGARVDRAATTGALGRERRRAEAKKRTPR